MNTLPEIKDLSIQYFSGTLPLDREKQLFEFISQTPANLDQFRAWEKEWIDAAQDNDDIHAEWESFCKKKVPFSRSPKFPDCLTLAFWKRAAAVAAILAAVVFSTLYIQSRFADSGQSDYVSVEAPYGEKSKITLSDGSVVWLNSGSKLTYAERHRKNVRAVTLSGEGYFEITKNKDRRFIVKTKTYDIEVVGTKFNVAAYNDDRYLTTTLMEGKINLLYENKKTELKPGESIVHDTLTGSFQKPDIPLENANAWIHNAIIYDYITLRELAVKLSRQYNVNIELQSDEIADKKFKVALRNDETISDAMRAIAQILDVEVRSIGINYYIGSKQISDNS